MVGRVSRCLLLLSVAAWAVAEETVGQGRPEYPPRRVDVEIAYASASWVWPVGSAWRLGPEFGLGILEQKTVAPSGDDFTALFHIGATSAVRVGTRGSLEFGLRLGMAELRSESCSGCLPGGFAGATGAVFFGGRRFQGGTRITLGGASGRGFVAWSPVLGRVQF
jgi:hypothetical protein